MTPTLPLRKALADIGLLAHTIAGPSWRAWRTLLIAAMGEPLYADERATFTHLTGREQEPLQRCEEFVGVIGRRGGKSRAISVLATYIAGLCSHPALVPGERGVLLVIAPDQRQADICLDYIEAAFNGSPILRQVVEARTARALRLTNRIDVHAAQLRPLPRKAPCITVRWAGYRGGPAATASFFGDFHQPRRVTPQFFLCMSSPRCCQ